MQKEIEKKIIAWGIMYVILHKRFYQYLWSNLLTVYMHGKNNILFSQTVFEHMRK